MHTGGRSNRWFGAGPTLQRDILAPFHVPLWPPRAVRLARFGWPAIQSTMRLVRRFRDDRARALVAGAGAHSILSLTEPVSGAAALVLLGSAHADGWPFPEGGSGRLAEALAAELVASGGRIETDRPVERMADLPPHRVALFDVAPRSLATIAGDRLPDRYRRRLERYRYGPGVFKIDVAIEGPIPWQAEGLDQAGTVHLGGTLEEIARAEAAVTAGRHPERPFVLLAQQSLFDPTRAPAGRHTVWAYCHVPNGSTVDMTEPILGQIERFAPGFRERILADLDDRSRGARGVQPELRGRRHRRRPVRPRPAVHPPQPPRVRPVRDARSRDLHLLGRHAAGRRRARHGRLARRALRASEARVGARRPGLMAVHG